MCQVYVGDHGEYAESVPRPDGVRLEGLKVLDIGPGQLLRHMRVLSVDNDVVGIDTDIIPQGKGLFDYADMLRFTTILRTAKTLALLREIWLGATNPSRPSAPSSPAVLA